MFKQSSLYNNIKIRFKIFNNTNIIKNILNLKLKFKNIKLFKYLFLKNFKIF